MLPVTVFKLRWVYLTLLMSKDSRFVRLPIAIGTGPRKFVFVRFLTNANSKLFRLYIVDV